MISKKEHRSKLLAERNALTPESVRQMSKTICENLISTDIYKKSKVIAAYMAFKNEVDLSLLIQNAFENQKRVLIPVTDNKNSDIFLAEIDKSTEFINGDFNIKVPKNPKKADFTGIDLMLVPGIVFDFSGGRIGWGKGYYDRLIAAASVKKTIGICYEFQLCGTVERYEHDCLLDYIVTESELVICE